MTNRTDFDRYQEYLSAWEADAGVTRVESLEEAREEWGVRSLSRSEFEALLETARRDGELYSRWQRRLRDGYHREKSRVAEEVEEVFAELAGEGQLPSRWDNAA